MTEILFTMKKFEEGLHYLEDAWITVREDHENGMSGTIMKRIANKVFDCMFSHLTFAEQHGLLMFHDEFKSKFAHEVDENLREEVRDTLWEKGPSYFYHAALNKVDWYKERSMSMNVAALSENEKIAVLEGGSYVTLMLNIFEPKINDDGQMVNSN